MMQNMLIGTYSQNGIYTLQFRGGSLYLLNTSDTFENCSYLSYSSNHIYGIVEYSEREVYKDGALISMTSTLSNQHAFPISGKGPCFILFDDIRNLLYIANYGNGTIDVFLLDVNGNITSSIYHKQYTSHSRIHHLALSEDKNMLFASDLGDNKIYAYQIIFENQTLELKDLGYYSFAKGTSPRHLAIYLNNIYVITEDSCELYHFTFSENAGFHFVNSISIVGNDRTANDTGCAIRISKDGKFIYASIRGKDCIYVFSTTPELKLIQTTSCFGKTPRDIQFDTFENYLLCANQNSRSISVFDRDQKTGLLQYNNGYHIDNPACIIPYEI